MAPRLIPPTTRPKTTRRRILQTAAAASTLVAAPMVIRGGLKKARAQTPGTIRMMGGPTLALEDWSLFEEQTGLTMEFTPFHVDDVGALYNEIIVNEAGERFDIINVLSPACTAASSSRVWWPRSIPRRCRTMPASRTA